MYEIGKLYNVDYRDIAEYNKIPIHQELIVGQTIVIINNDSAKLGNKEINGYVLPGIDENVLNTALPHLTYLSVFSYRIDYSGSIVPINDDHLINKAKEYNVMSIMVITSIGKSDKFDSDLARSILYNEIAQKTLINSVLNILSKHNYGGLNIDFEYIYPEDREAYINFVKRVSNVLKKHNYLLSISVAPKTSSTQKGLLYEAHDYKALGELADFIVLMTYEWGYSGGPARAIAPITLVEEVIKYAVTEIPPSKIMMGIPNYGYDWTLPYKKGNIAKSVSNYEAVNIARANNQSISYSYENQAPHFNYFDPSKTEHEVWFEDARSIQSKLNIIVKYNLKGASYWTINRVFPQNYLVLKSIFDITKIKTN